MARAHPLESSDSLWRENGDYYRYRPEELLAAPVLPDLSRVQEQRVFALFDRHGGLGPGRHVLELGCGGSQWLPLLAQRFHCTVEGIDVEPSAAELARANLRGAGVEGVVYTRDAFALQDNSDLVGRLDLVFSRGVLEHFSNPVERLGVAREYLKPGGVLLTTVPNLHGVNSALQRFGDVHRFHMHVVYDRDALVAVHRRADLEVVAAGYAGFLDAYVSSVTRNTPLWRGRLHARACYVLGMLTQAWLAATRSSLAPELAWLSPHVFVVARRPRG